MKLGGLKMRKKKEPVIVEKIEEVVEDTKIEEVHEEKQEINTPDYYTLKIGETLNDVAKKFNLDEKALKELNGEVVGTNQIKLK